jgi:hypothetical protein
MWEILAREMNGFIVLADSVDRPSFSEAGDLIGLFSNLYNVPYLVAANKTDLPGAASLIDVRRGTRAADNITVMPCVATQKTSVRQVLLQIIELIDKQRAS